MIPYEDLVVALQAWRVKQGLPVGGLSGSFTPPPAHAPAPAPSAPPPRAAPPTPPPRAASPPMPPPRATPPPLAPPDLGDVEEAHVLEDHYANEGDDYAMSFDHVEHDGESTSHSATEIDDGGGSLLKPKPRRSDDW
jgi:hypothetical protein